MSTINVQFQGDFSNVPNVPVPVEVVDSSLNTVHETTVLLGSPKSVGVSAPGLYLVRAVLPSGERVAACVTIPPPSAADPNPSVTATLSPSDLSPHETVAWAYTVQGVQRATGSPPLAASAGFLKTLIAGSPESNPALTVTPGCAYRNMGASNDVFRLQTDPQATLSLAPQTGDPRVVLHLQVSRPPLENADTPQWWPYYQDLDIKGGPQPVRLLVAVPPSPQSQIVLVRSDSDMAAHPVRPLVQGGDPRADALLSYLTQGAFADARAISGSITDEEIQEILGQKRKDPASAVVSAYYQLRAGTVAYPKWVKNLADLFVLIPDGAIQYGWCVLRQATPDHDSARTYFLTAAQRGIPIYSYGVRLLYDGLNLFAERSPNDAEVATAFRAVRRLAAATDWHAAVTSLTLIGSADSPSVVAFGG